MHGSESDRRSNQLMMFQNTIFVCVSIFFQLELKMTKKRVKVPRKRQPFFPLFSKITFLLFAKSNLSFFGKSFFSSDPWTRIRQMHPKRKKKRKLYKPSYPVILHQRNKSLLSKLWKVEKSLILESKIRDFCRNLPKKKSLILDLNCTIADVSCLL